MLLGNGKCWQRKRKEWSSTRGAYTIRQKKEGNLETREEFASRCNWEGVTVTRKKQKTT